MRIVVVDDSEDSRDLTEGALLSAGYTDIVTAASGWQALRILDIGGQRSDQPPGADVALLDIVMPEMDGVELCARIRTDSRYADLPIIMVTSLDDMNSLSNAFVAGANDYVTKPVNRIELVARVRAALRLKHELDRRQERERELLSFLSNWGDRRAGIWMDDATGLFVGEVAEAYLVTYHSDSGETISVFALTVDRFDAYRAANGDVAAREVLALVARAVRRLTANVGVVAAAYKNGMFTLVAPELSAAMAREFGELLRATVHKLRSPSSESVASDYLTASVVAVSGAGSRDVDRVRMLTRAIATVQQIAVEGGNSVASLVDDGVAAHAGGRVAETLPSAREIGASA